MKVLGFELKKIHKVPLPLEQTKPSGVANTLPAVSSARVLNDPGTVVWQAGDQVDQVRSGYSGNDIVYSIVRIITDKVKMAPWYEMEVVDEVSYKRFNAVMQRPDLVKDWRKVDELYHKALKPVTRKSRVSDLLKYPNEQDSWGDLIEAYSGFKLITGNAYIYAKQIPMGANQGVPLQLYNLPSQYMSIYADLNVFPIVPKSYMLYMQYLENFTKEEILHDKYFNPNWNIVGNQLYGLSPLQAAAKVVTRSNEGKQAAVSNYQNGGPKGILFTADDRYDPQQSVQEAIDIKKSLARNQGSRNVNQVETSGYKVDYVPLGLSPVELDLLNAESFDIQALCNVYGVPAALLGVKGGMTYNGMPEAEKALTVRCALPMLHSIQDQFNRKLASDWGEQKTVIAFDPSVYQELQEDRSKQVAWLKDSYLPLRRRLEIMGESTEGYTDEQLNTIFMPSGVTTMDDILMQDTITPPDGLNDYAKP